MRDKTKKTLIYILGVGVFLGAICAATDYADRKNKETPIVVTILHDLGSEFSSGKSL